MKQLFAALLGALLLLPTAAYADQNLHLDLDGTAAFASPLGQPVGVYDASGTFTVMPFTAPVLNKVMLVGTVGDQYTAALWVREGQNFSTNNLTYNVGGRVYFSPSTYFAAGYGTQFADYSVITDKPPALGFNVALHTHVF